MRSARVARSAGHKTGGVFIENGQEVSDTVRCCHCSRQFIYTKGMAELRLNLPDMRRGGAIKLAVIRQPTAFCMNCGELTCGAKECSPNYCVPFEKKLEDYEKGKRQSLYYWDPDAR